jgi:hypothetical protein
MSAPALLRRVEGAARRQAVARQSLEESVRAAAFAGLSLRDIAAAAGVSHEQVRRILQRTG